MKKQLVILALTFSLMGCGSDTDSFGGVWSGSFTRMTNSCPFTVAEKVSPLFPMTVSIDTNEVFTVVAVDGSTAVGGQGVGENISFLANSSNFGSYGTTLPYVCDPVTVKVGFLSVGDNEANITVTYPFNNCAIPGSSDIDECVVTYFAPGATNN